MYSLKIVNMPILTKLILVFKLPKVNNKHVKVEFYNE